MLFFGIGLAVGILTFAVTRRIVLSILMFLFNWWAMWQFLPVMNFDFFGLPILLFVDGGIILLSGKFLPVGCPATI